MRRKNNFVMQNVGGETLLVPLGAQVMDMNAIITLNSTSGFIWSLLDQDRSIDELAAAVVERFEVDPARARTDIQKFLDEIADLGLLQ
jgi:hypothetical protein